MITIKKENQKLLIVGILSVFSVILLHVFLLTLKMPIIQPKKTQKTIKINLVTINNKPIKKVTTKTIKKSITKPKIKNTPKEKFTEKKSKTTQKKLTQVKKTEKQKITLYTTILIIIANQRYRIDIYH